MVTKFKARHDISIKRLIKSEQLESGMQKTRSLKKISFLMITTFVKKIFKIRNTIAIQLTTT